MKKSFFEKCWESKRWHSLILLLLWIVALAILFGVFTLINRVNKDLTTPSHTVQKNDQPSHESQKSSVLSYTEKLNALALEDYTFLYTILNGTYKVQFEGQKENNIVTGYKQDENEIIKYQIENQKIYQVLLDKKIETSKLYDNIDASLLDLNYIIGILKQVNENDIIITEEETETSYDYNLTKDEEALEITVIEDHDGINKIEITRDNEKYTLQYFY